tara:strand:- start:1692 stop:2063 length:372 start_codon:yes stop_codon:yes gene_type:complete
MPRKKLEDLDKDIGPAVETQPDAVVVSTSDTTTRKVKLDLEVDTSVKDMGPNPYARLIHMARAVDAWRIFPRMFLTVYIVLLYKCVIWYMNLPDPSMEQSGLISIVVGAGAAWFGLYTGTSKK